MINTRIYNLTLKIFSLCVFISFIGTKSQAQALKNYAEGNCMYTKGNGSGFWQEPCNAFDGDLSTTTKQGKSWGGLALSVDFGEERQIEKVVVYYDVTTTKNGHPDPDLGFVVLGSSNGDNWQTLKTLSSTGIVDSVSELNAAYRYMKVQFPAFGFDPTWSHSFKEIQMWGPSSEPAKIFRSKKLVPHSNSYSRNKFYYNLIGRKINPDSHNRVSSF